MNGIAAELKSSAVGGEYDDEFVDADDGNAFPMAPNHINVSIGSLFVLVVDDELDNSGACEPIAPNTLAVGALKLALNNPFIFNGSEKLEIENDTKCIQLNVNNFTHMCYPNPMTLDGQRLTLNLN